MIKGLGGISLTEEFMGSPHSSGLEEDFHKPGRLEEVELLETVSHGQ